MPELVTSVPTPCIDRTDCSSYDFADVGLVGTWYHETMNYVLKNGLMNGYDNGLFHPDKSLSRAQFAQILYNKAGKPAMKIGSMFSDVASEAWYAPAVTWAAANGIVGGYRNGLFEPEDNITREQLAVMLWRYAGTPAATDKELHFADAGRVSSYAAETLRWAAEKNVVNGTDKGKFDPQGAASYMEAAQMMVNFVQNNCHFVLAKNPVSSSVLLTGLAFGKSRCF